MQKSIYSSLFIFCANLAAIAQCAMCKATAEQGAANGNEESHWLNYGILMLMILPLLIILGIYWMYRKNHPTE